jgi:hypothetical protein
MRLIPRLLLGGHRELKRPANVVDEALMQRIEEVRRDLRIKGIDVKPLRASRPSAPSAYRGRAPLDNGTRDYDRTSRR